MANDISQEEYDEPEALSVAETVDSIEELTMRLFEPLGRIEGALHNGQPNAIALDDPRNKGIESALARSEDNLKRLLGRYNWLADRIG